MVQHRSDAVKSKPIELVFLQIPTDIGQQKSQNFVFLIVKQTRIPQRVDAPRAGVEEARVGTVETVQAVHYIFAGMGVNQVQ